MDGPHRLMAALVVPLALAVAPRAAAQDAGASAAGRSGAEESSAAAERLYNAGRFEAAAEAYGRAYELFPHPAFLFNLAQCYRELGEHDRALFHYAAYLRAEPATPHREVVEGLMDGSRAALERDAEAGPSAGSDRPRRRGSRARAEQRPFYRSWWFWTAIGGAVAITAATATAAGVLSAEERRSSSPSLGTVDWR